MEKGLPGTHDGEIGEPTVLLIGVTDDAVGGVSITDDAFFLECHEGTREVDSGGNQ